MKRNAGRPPLLEDVQIVRAYLDVKSVKAAKQIGAGNVSAGIRKALALAKEAQATASFSHHVATKFRAEYGDDHISDAIIADVVDYLGGDTPEKAGQ